MLKLASMIANQVQRSGAFGSMTSSFDKLGFLLFDWIWLQAAVLLFLTSPATTD